ncbi:hypothetical protein QLH52_11360 [Methylomonas sp. OY6]|uniref:Uncharacterized protein n=1 Tax=Methylomonas defluvii TaxID=3045149 RepID=A0ABU4UEN4_9GAMM|nr:hypothetical protein [Methylomonas sp. OY6]MDX8127881.1 hypothetical protein [Methylomonas sp. OY6]
MSEEHGNYNWIYKRLADDPSDMVGALAYVIYKRQKIAYIQAYADEHGGQEPDDDALKSFNIATDTEIAAAGFRAQAEVILDKFLDQVLAGQLEQMQQELQESTLATTSRTVETNVRNDIESSKQLIQSEISKVLGNLTERKGVSGWLRDLGTNFLVNLLTVIVIGMAVVGYGAFDTFNTFLKQAIENKGKPAIPSEHDKQ